MESTLLLLLNNPLPQFNGLEQQPIYLLSILLIGTLPGLSLVVLLLVSPGLTPVVVARRWLGRDRMIQGDLTEGIGSQAANQMTLFLLCGASPVNSSELLTWHSLLRGRE